MMEYMIQKSLGVELSDPRVRAQMNLLVEYVDEDGSGDISFSEFVVLFLSVVVAAPKVKKLSNLNVALTPAAEIANLKKMFDEMDEDGYSFSTPPNARMRRKRAPTKHIYRHLRTVARHTQLHTHTHPCLLLSCRAQLRRVGSGGSHLVTQNDGRR